MGTRKTDYMRPIDEGHLLRGRSLSNQTDEFIVPGWLNAAKGTQSYTRVTRLLALFGAIQGSAENLRLKGALMGVGARERPREQARLWHIDHRLHTEFAAALKRYLFKVRPIHIAMERSWLMSLYCERRKDEFAWHAPLGEIKPQPGETVLTPTQKFVVSEGDVVLAIARLVERGLFGRIRRCTMCSDRWLFARHSNYKFCTEECANRFFTSTDEYRERKKLQMQRYRQRLRERDKGKRP